MLFLLHGWDIHAVSAEPGPEAASYELAEIAGISEGYDLGLAERAPVSA